jgi:hypothetical protein
VSVYQPVVIKRLIIEFIRGSLKVIGSPTFKVAELVVTVVATGLIEFAAIPLVVVCDTDSVFAEGEKGCWSFVSTVARYVHLPGRSSF